ncbi:MAG TPA: hypothetical protein VG895_01680 [Patescibacteria group bacterium]|nr:hypothetical protein [Patescibacteria group bacterium]
MDFLKQNKLLVGILFLAILFFCILGGIVFYLSHNSATTVSVQTKSFQSGGLTVNNNSGFNLSKFDSQTATSLKNDGIKTLQFQFTSVPTAIVTHINDSAGNSLPYVGYNLVQNGSEMTVTLYVNTDTAEKLNKTQKDLEFDALQQFFVGLEYYQENLASNNTAPQGDQGSLITQHFTEAGNKANMLVNNGSVPFNISFN